MWVPRGASHVICSAKSFNQLIRDLRRSGAFRNRTNVKEDAEAPLVTITSLMDAGNSTNSVANTFSFFEASGLSLRVLNLLDTFFTEITSERWTAANPPPANLVAELESSLASWKSKSGK